MNAAPETPRIEEKQERSIIDIKTDLEHLDAVEKALSTTTR